VSVRSVRLVATIFFIAFALAVTWPAMIPFNRIEPLVFGLPFSMFWIACWVAVSFLVLVWVDRSEERAREAED